MPSSIAPLFRSPTGQPDPQSQRAYHRLTTVRTTDLTHAPLSEATTPQLYLGRMTPHYQRSERVFPRWLLREDVPVQQLVGQRSGDLTASLHKMTVMIAQATSGRLIYTVTADFEGDATELISILEDFHYESLSLTALDGTTTALPAVVDRLVRRLVPEAKWQPAAEVHQLLFLAANLCGDQLGPATDRELALNREFLVSLVYRVGGPLRDGFTSVQFPGELNRGMRVLGAVGSFVSVFAGHQDYVENAMLKSALNVLSATSELRVIERDIAESYGLVRNQLDSVSRSRRQALLQRVSGQLALHEMNLSDYVESAVDIGLWIPSLRIEEYHRTLASSVRLSERAQLLSRSISRLTAIVAARAQVLAVEEQQLQEHHRRSWALVAGILTSVAVPISLVLAFFGVSASNVDPKASIFDWQRYSGVYFFAAGLLVSSVLIVACFYFFGHPRRIVRRSAQR